VAHPIGILPTRVRSRSRGARSLRRLSQNRTCGPHIRLFGVFCLASPRRCVAFNGRRCRPCCVWRARASTPTAVESATRHYFASSLARTELSDEQWLGLIRLHGNVENNCYGGLDVSWPSRTWGPRPGGDRFRGAHCDATHPPLTPAFVGAIVPSSARPSPDNLRPSRPAHLQIQAAGCWAPR
jgi:hypothetical protein